MTTSSERGSTESTPLTWSNAIRAWEFTDSVLANTGLTWDDYVLLKFISGAGANIKEIIDELPSEKKKRLVRLVMRRRGIKMYDEAKEVQNISAQVNDIKLIISEVKKAKVTMEMSHV